MVTISEWDNCKVARCVTRKHLGLLMNQKKEKYSGVYAVYEEGGTLCKIGSSQNISKRIQNVQTSNPRKLHLYAMVICEPSATKFMENVLHKVFKQYWVRGEWYNIHPYVLLRFLCNLEYNFRMGSLDWLMP